MVFQELKQLPDVITSDARMMNAGIRMKTAALDQLMEIRTWQEMLFLVNGMKTCDKDALKAVETITSSKLIEFMELHQNQHILLVTAEWVKIQLKILMKG